jgi:hypothetical protein
MGVTCGVGSDCLSGTCDATSSTCSAGRSGSPRSDACITWCLVWVPEAANVFWKCQMWIKQQIIFIAGVQVLVAAHVISP